MKHGKSALLLSLLFACITFSACNIYSFTGAVPMPGVKTFSVSYFTNRAKLVNPNLSQQFTDALQEKLTRQTSYKLISEDGDLEFSGQITDYNVKPMNIQRGDVAAQSRLTIEVKVKYINNKNHDEDWEKTFTQYEDFESSTPFDQAEEQLVADIIKKLTEDIFNSSIANW